MMLISGLRIPVLIVSLVSGVAWAGVNTTPRFIKPGNWSLGLEPEFIMTSGAGIGANMRFTYGITDLNNMTLILGTGGGPRRFRVGGNATFDIFPDVEGQPGIGIAAQGIYYRIPGGSFVEAMAIPYLHKAMASGSNQFEPYVAVPFGMAFNSGNYQAITSLSVGSMFRASDDVSYVLELGVAINNTESYIAGGVVYYH